MIENSADHPATMYIRVGIFPPAMIAYMYEEKYTSTDVVNGSKYGLFFLILWIIRLIVSPHSGVDPT